MEPAAPQLPFLYSSLSDDTFRSVYNELRRVAAARMKAEPAGITLQPTALVHEAFVRLAVAGSRLQIQDRTHFLALASRAMRHILVDRARERQAQKRGGNPERVELNDSAASSECVSYDVLALHESLASLERADPDAARVVELKFFGGCTDDEAAAVLGQSLTGVRRHWTFARAWLAARLDDTR